MIFMGVKLNPPAAPPAHHVAVLALPLVRLQVSLVGRELAVGISALKGEVHGLDGLLGDQVADSIKKIKTYMNERHLIMIKMGSN